MTGLKKLNSCLFSILVATTVVSAQADVFSSRSAKHGGAYVSVEGFDADVLDTFLTNSPYAGVTQADQTNPDQTNEIRFLYFDPDREWGFRVAVGYDFRSCCPCNYGGSLEYTYFNFDDHRSFSLPIAGVGFFNSIGPVNARFENGFFHVVDAKIDSRYDAVDLLGHVNRAICKCVDTQFFIGARYVRLDQSFHEHFIGAAPVFGTQYDQTIHFKNRFNGIGPRLGIAGFYPIVRNFGLTSEVAGNLIFGRTINSYAEDLIAVNGLPPDAVTITSTFRGDSKSREKFVPGWSGKIALAYHADFCNCSSLTIEAGYRGDKYYEISNIKTLLDGVVSDNGQVKDGAYHDFEFSGPYVSLAYHM